MTKTETASQGTGLFASLAEQLNAIRQLPFEERSDGIYPVQGSYNNTVDPRLRVIQRRVASGASEAVPADGGFLIAPEFVNDVVQEMTDVGKVFSRCWRIPMLTNSIKLPLFDETSRANGSRFGGVNVYFENEADAFIKSKPKFGAIELNTKKIIGLLELTNELAFDSNAFETWAPRAFGRELVFKLENTIINGTGAGQPLGILNAPGVVTVGKETGQATRTIVSANVENMLDSLRAPSVENACWLYNPEQRQELSQLDTPAGSERKLWQWTTDVKQPNMLAGIPAFPCEYCPAPGSAGDLILADLSYYALGVRELMRAEMSIQVLFLSDQNCFRFVMRADGQPLNRISVVPLNGTIATSPFVALAARP